MCMGIFLPTGGNSATTVMSVSGEDGGTGDNWAGGGVGSLTSTGGTGESASGVGVRGGVGALSWPGVNQGLQKLGGVLRAA